MASPAAAQIITNVLKVEEQDLLCEKQDDQSPWRVHPGNLAFAILDQVDMPSYAIDYANQGKTADGNREDSEAIYLVLNDNRALPERVKRKQKVADALQNVVKYRESLHTFLNTNVIVSGFKVGAETGRVKPADYFHNGKAQIECLLVPDSPLLDPTRMTTAAEDAGSEAPEGHCQRKF